MTSDHAVHDIFASEPCTVETLSIDRWGRPAATHARYTTLAAAIESLDPFNAADLHQNQEISTISDPAA